MGHFCRICGRIRANERFGGRGHCNHVCKECQRLPREERDHIECLDELHGFLHQSVISPKNLTRLEMLTAHPHPKVAALAALILDIARAFPGKRNRWVKLSQSHRPILDRAVALLGIEFFEDFLAAQGGFESPLWYVLEPFRRNS